MLAHADVYVVAEFFQVPALAKMAASVIDDELKARFADMLGVFPKLAQTICAGIPASADDDPSSCFSYFSTPKTLRGRVMKFGHQHMHAFTTADRLWDVLDEAPDFMEEAIEGMRLKLTVAANRISGLEDRVAALHITLGRYQAYKCPCGERFKMAMPTTAGVTVGCPRNLRDTGGWFYQEIGVPFTWGNTKFLPGHAVEALAVEKPLVTQSTAVGIHTQEVGALLLENTGAVSIHTQEVGALVAQSSTVPIVPAHAVGVLAVHKTLFARSTAVGIHVQEVGALFARSALAAQGSTAVICPVQEFAALVARSVAATIPARVVGALAAHKAPSEFSLITEAMESGVFSDVTLILRDGSELTCHRILLRSCDFFKNALEPGGFQESLTRIIYMKNDPPQATDEPHAANDEEPDDDDEEPELGEPEFKQYRRRMANMMPKEIADAVVAHAEVYTDSVLDVFPQLVGIVHSGVPTENCALHKDLVGFARDNVSALTSGPTFQKMVDNSTEFTQNIMHELATAMKPTELKVERLEKRVSELNDQLVATRPEPPRAPRRIRDGRTERDVWPGQQY
ncbi:hypothetical protein UCDDS831_g09242 [Diplodia seriata]|uniref:BTB domain-containing protein n=1 Tax=Diplodia seriata TaxID=420778 RepID=A0A0G2DR54_9PEZI|nr:hypothetical protein UCDDS831_g09242 [Diplodia seriata]